MEDHDYEIGLVEVIPNLTYENMEEQTCSAIHQFEIHEQQSCIEKIDEQTCISINNVKHEQQQSCNGNKKEKKCTNIKDFENHKKQYRDAILDAKKPSCKKDKQVLFPILKENREEYLDELMDVNFEEYGKIMNFSAKNGTLYWLRDNKLLIDSCKCQSCGSIMQLKKKASVLDGKVWRCATTTCRTTTSIRHRSFFKQQKLPIPTLMKVIYMWARNYPVPLLKCEARVEFVTFYKLRNSFRKICSNDLNSKPLGGAGCIIALGEATRKIKIKSKVRKVQYVIGGVDLRTNHCFLQLMDTLDQQSIESTLKRCVLPGTEIHSQELDAYKNLSELGYTHRAVPCGKNLLKEHGSPGRLMHNAWADCCRHALLGVRSHDSEQSVIDEFVWRRRRPRNRILPDFLMLLREQTRS